MKNMFLITLAFLASFFNSVLAQNQNALPMFSSPAALRSYAVEQVTQLQSVVYSSSALAQNGTWIESFWSGPQSASVLSQKVNASFVGMNLSDANPDDSLNAWTYLQNTDGDILFYGGGNGQPIWLGGNKYRVMIGITLEMNSVIPVPIAGAVSAEVFVVNKDGGYTEESVSLDVSGGKVYMQTNLVGQGILAVTKRDGSVVLYNMSAGGTVINATSLAPVASASFDNVLTFTNPLLVTDVVQSSDGVGTNPTFELTMTSKTTVGFNVRSSEYTYPIGYYVRLQGTAGWQFYSAGLTGVSGSANLPFSQGVWYIIPVWDANGVRDPDPVNSGEKG